MHGQKNIKLAEIKFVPFHNKTVYRGSKIIAPIILNLYGIWRRVVGFTPPPLFVWERTHVPPEQEAGFVSEPVWNIWRKPRTPYHAARNLVTLQLRYAGCGN